MSVKDQVRHGDQRKFGKRETTQPPEKTLGFYFDPAILRTRNEKLQELGVEIRQSFRKVIGVNESRVL